MALSGFFEKLARKKPETPEFFLAIQIDTEFVKTAVWTVRENLTEVVALGSTSEWDGSSTQVLVEAIDSSFSIALEKIGDQPEPTRAIFGLPETWVTPDGVAQPRLTDLKTICEKLELKPLGFVVATEAIAHYLKATEGTPLSAILLRVSASEVTVTVVHLGTIEGTHVAGRSGDLAADVREGLVRFGDRDSFPSRMLLYNGDEDLEDLSQQLLAYDWQSSMPFLHIPKIEPLDERFSITAIARAGGGEVAKSLGFTVIEMGKEGRKEERIETRREERRETSGEEMEIEKKEREEQETETMEVKDIEEETKTKEIKTTTESRETAEPEPEIIPSISPKRRRIVIPLGSIWKAVLKSIAVLIGAVRRFPMPRFIFPGRGIGLTLVFILLFFGGIMVAAIQVAKRVPRATITVEFEGQTVNQRLKMHTATSIQNISAETGELPAQEVSVRQQAEASKEATGKETTGEKATGRVTVYNRRTDGAKTFTAGTTVTDPKSKLSFTMDSDVSVASASADSDYSVIPGKQTVAVTAEGHGPEYNFDAGIEFQIANFSTSTYVAKSDDAFSGGSKREIHVVSRKDQTTLRDDLVATMKDRAKTEIESQSGGRTTFLETMTVRLTKETFSAKVGEEASSVSLTLTADITALAIDEMVFHDLLAAMLAPFVPDGFNVVPEKLTVTIDGATATDDGISFDANVSAPVTPTVDRATVLKRVVGLRPTLAADAVKTLPHFKRMEVLFSPTLPPFLRWIPVSEDHIDLVIRLTE